ncbi:hypothetical protein BDZ94DRAFT_1258948 [Collybia nuda]|uniref:Uncharacterized protein n=1 Tax=Collybia nuda TaxID=64659 RepID=A0A9P5Y859_9AGAR|nr:hypothetical protein BDZ94DRAFT_1258948 [Collybia nuda]
MSGKTISTGTMGLRFMQNAQRAKQLKEVEAEKAHVKDEAEWEVDQKVREAWGISSTNSSSHTVTHETSYLPFLFPSLEESTDPSLSERPKGRRAFNKKGEEIKEKEPDPITAQTEDQKVPQPPTKKSRVHPRPISISGSSGTLSGFPEKVKSTKTAKEAIYDNAGVGTDLRTKSLPSAPVFLKPAGVDEPSTRKPDNTKSRNHSRGSHESPQKSNDDPNTPDLDNDTIPNTRSKRAKRERSTPDQIESGGPKRRKKKSVS